VSVWKPYKPLPLWVHIAGTLLLFAIVIGAAVWGFDR
jgi:hypothetical protein